MGTYNGVTREVLNETVELLRRGSALTGVLMAYRLRAMDQHGQRVGAGQLHDWRHLRDAGDIETLSVRV